MGSTPDLGIDKNLPLKMLQGILKYRHANVRITDINDPCETNNKIKKTNFQPCWSPKRKLVEEGGILGR